MRLILFLTTSVTILWSLNAQMVNAHNVGNTPVKVVTNYDKVEGTPYYGDGKWYTGLIITQDEQYLTDRKIRYNAYDDQIQYLEKNNPFYYDNKVVKSFEYSEVDDKGELERYYFANGYEYKDNLSKINFVRVIFDGANVTVLNRIKTVKQKVTPANYGAADYDKFFDVSQAYIVKDGEVDKFKIGRSSTLKAFPSKKKEIKSYIDENLISFNRTNDVVKLFKYIDSIL